MNKSLDIVELFSGIGAPRKALVDLKIKHRTLFISEINKNAINCYNKIFNDDVLNIGDISNYNYDISKFKNKIDILFFGSPCQDFSQGGNNKGGFKNSKTRSSLLWNAVDIIEKTKPKIILFENVKNIISKKHISIINEYFDELKNMGYFSSKPIILNSKNFGIPQNRERVFILSFLDKNKYEYFKKIEWEKKYKNNISLKIFLNIKNFLNRTILNQKIEHRKWKNFSTWTASSGNINGSYNRAWKINSYCGTLNVCNIIKITDDEYISKLTPYESWKLMGFKKNDFNKISNLIPENEQYKLAGNSIVVGVIKEIINEII